ISSTLCGAVLVENGQRLHESGTFVNQQWLWFNIATMFAAIVGGQLVQHLAPETALHVAAAIVAVAPVSVIGGTIFLVPEKKSRIDLKGMRTTFQGLISGFRRRELWIVALFIFLYYFSPGLSTPLYYHMTDDLRFSQAYIGLLTSISAAGWVAGALLYRAVFWIPDAQEPSVFEHRLRHDHRSCLSFVLERDRRGDHQPLRRILRHAGDGGDIDAGRRLFAATCRRIFVRGTDVDHQSGQHAR